MESKRWNWIRHRLHQREVAAAVPRRSCRLVRRRTIKTPPNMNGVSVVVCYNSGQLLACDFCVCCQSAVWAAPPVCWCLVAALLIALFQRSQPSCVADDTSCCVGMEPHVVTPGFSWSPFIIHVTERDGTQHDRP